MSSRRARASERGQAVVESALTLPLLVFAVLGTIQLFMMLQGRILAEYAAFRATRVGSTHSGDCDAMTDAALLALLPSYGTFLNPSISGATPAQKMSNAFRIHQPNKYIVGVDWNSSVTSGGDIVWILRELPSPLFLFSLSTSEDVNFDDPSDPLTLSALRSLQIQLVYWFPLKIPFANWVMMKMFLAEYGLAYSAQNPLMEAQKANWQPDRMPPSVFVSYVVNRYANGEMVFPILASATLRMMTPAKQKYWLIGGVQKQNCPPAPDAP